MSRLRPGLGAILAVLVAAPLLAGPARAASPGARTATDAYSVATPPRPWERADQLDAAGQLSWSAHGPGGSAALLRVGFEGVVERDAGPAIAAALGRLRAGIRSELEDREGVERGGFEPDSMVSPGGLRWRGFRVTVRTAGRTAVVGRWIALHPGFPARRRLFTLSYDQVAPPGVDAGPREAEARAVATGLVPAGRGLAGPLSEAWLDARAAAFAARIDSAQKLCWTARPDAAPGRGALGFGRGLVLEGDLFMLTERVPGDSLVDAAPSEYGAAFDRNGDGRVDLWVLNRGVRKFAGPALQPTVAVYADDDFDGRVDGWILEEADGDGDGRVDARLEIHDADGDGRPDEAHRFGDSASAPPRGGDRLALAAGGVRVRRIENTSGILATAEEFRAATLFRSELDRARERCPRP